jgi:5'(3')-deoxyribonucleotidase
MRLGIDLDGVVADFSTGWISRYNTEFGAELRSEQVESWNAMAELTHFDTMGAFWRWAEGEDHASIFRHLETYPDAVETLARLDREHEIVILTAKPNWAVHDTFAWIADHRIPTREVHITNAKWRVPCDVYLDDAPHQIEDIHRNRPESVMCRMVRPWNAPRPGVRDVRDWDEFEALVNTRWC